MASQDHSFWRSAQVTYSQGPMPQQRHIFKADTHEVTYHLSMFVHSGVPIALQHHAGAVKEQLCYFGLSASFLLGTRPYGWKLC